jgi:hypothetical protein
MARLALVLLILGVCVALCGCEGIILALSALAACPKGC